MNKVELVYGVGPEAKRIPLGECERREAWGRLFLRVADYMKRENISELKEALVVVNVYDEGHWIPGGRVSDEVDFRIEDDGSLDWEWSGW